MQSRLDVLNDPARNGERLLQDAFAAASSAIQKIVVFDVGANVGDWSKSMLGLLDARRASIGDCRIHLFEPAPAARARATEALMPWMSRLHVEINQAAVADEPGELSFYLFNECDGINTLQPLPDDAPKQQIRVDCTTVDLYCKRHDIRRIDFMKVDTEGNDYRVLLGAKEMLARQQVGLAQFEYNHRWIAFRRYLKDVFDLVRPLGYNVGKITPRGIERYRDWHFELESFREGNYLVWHGSLPAGLAEISWWMD
jgi:FkbM family methyltransferase